MRSAICTYALAVTRRALPKEALTPAAGIRGGRASPTARGCAANPAALAMLPVPPELSTTVDDSTEAQLFRIVKHGIRVAGMPAWPAGRRRQVWIMVEFPRALPGLDTDD